MSQITELQSVPRSWADGVYVGVPSLGAGAVTAPAVANGAITGLACSVPLATRQLQGVVPTVAATGTTEFLLMVPDTGTLVAVFVAFKDALAQDATNWARFQIVNKSQGNILLLSNTDVNTTKTGTGTALAAYGLRQLQMAGGAALNVNAGDILAVQVISNATLANTLTEGAFLVKVYATN